MRCGLYARSHRQQTPLALAPTRPLPAGKLYPDGLPIWGEEELEAVIKEQRVDRCMLAYSDLPHR